MKGPELIQTERLALRKPTPADADAIFTRYAGSAEITRYMSWPTHRTIADTRAFLAWSHAEWKQWPAGPYLAFGRETGQLLGGTGLTFTSPTHAITGYIFARDAWGKGYATEVMFVMIDLAGTLGVKRLEATVHVDHRASAHVLEKAGFVLEKLLPQSLEFPNLEPGIKSDTHCYVRLF